MAMAAVFESTPRPYFTRVKFVLEHFVIAAIVAASVRVSSCPFRTFVLSCRFTADNASYTDGERVS